MLTIGQFSKTCQITVKALHHYDKIGLLHPAEVDRWTGYRYYDESQIAVTLLIQKLKRYGFSLGEICALLEEDDSGKALRALRVRREALLGEMEHVQYVLHELDLHMKDIERTKDIMAYQNNYKIEIENANPTPILSVRDKISIDDFGKYYGKLFEKVAMEKIRVAGSTLAIYHDEEFDCACSDVELALIVADDKDATRVLDGGKTVTTIHKGGYSGLPEAYGAIMKYLHENNLELANAPYEIYVKTQFDKLPVDEWETKVVFPVK